MESNNSKQVFLQQVKEALTQGACPLPFPELTSWDMAQAFQQTDLAPDELFVQQFTAIGGKFVYCTDQQQLFEQLEQLFSARAWTKVFCTATQIDQYASSAFKEKCIPIQVQDDSADACITNCEALLARTGSFLISSRQTMGRTSTIFYPVHIVIATLKDIVSDIDAGYQLLKDRYGDQLPSMISIQTGPSRTADIEKTLVTGVHGPKEVFCFLVEETLI